jgi:prepilin-type N-terminal cleavage/methylation domain-containing protein
MHGGQKGFTLIELLIVVAILGIIAAVVIPNISGFMITGELSAANSEAEQVKTAALAYFGEHGVWPDTSSQLVPHYISGTLQADYNIDGYGWLVSANNTGWSPLIVFGEGECAADSSPTGHHGCWARDTSP